MKTQYFLLLVLTLCLTSYILYRGRKTKTFPGIVYSQSNIHVMIKDFLPKGLYERPMPKSQALKHADKNSVKVVFIEDKAYWVANNIFYCAEVIGGNVNIDTTKPVDTNNMSKKDIDKMLFVLDNLRDEESDDSSSAGN